MAAATINAIVGARLGGSASWAGAPSATYQGGAALVAFVWGLAMDRIGRRHTLALGLGCGVVGAALASRAVTAGSLPLFLLGLGLMGMANSALQLGRFVAAEVHPPARRGRAISTVVLGGTVGAVFGPALVRPAGAWARGFGIDELSGPYAISSACFALVVVLLLLGLRPEPREVARAVAGLDAGPAGERGDRRPLAQILRDPLVRVAITTLVFGQAVMVMLMVITSLHMSAHQHGLGSIALVLSSHVFGMFAFSVVSGRLADRFGRRVVILTGASALGFSCVAAPLSPRVIPLAAALFLLGLGWNFCYVGGSALLADRLQPLERARTQGLNDLLIGLALGERRARQRPGVRSRGLRGDGRGRGARLAGAPRARPALARAEGGGRSVAHQSGRLRSLTAPTLAARASHSSASLCFWRAALTSPGCTNERRAASSAASIPASISASVFSIPSSAGAHPRTSAQALRPSHSIWYWRSVVARPFAARARAVKDASSFTSPSWRMASRLPGSADGGVGVGSRRAASAWAAGTAGGQVADGAGVRRDPDRAGSNRCGDGGRGVGGFAGSRDALGVDGSGAAAGAGRSGSPRPLATCHTIASATATVTAAMPQGKGAGASSSADLAACLSA
jgi:MFS family permease